MTKFIYYLKIFLFILYLLVIFLLIDNLYRNNFFALLYFIINFVYAIITILTIISKKAIFQKSIPYNLLNIAVYVYTFIIYYIVSHNTKLDILNNEVYFRNNYIMLSIILISLTIYTLYLNKNDNH